MWEHDLYIEHDLYVEWSNAIYTISIFNLKLHKESLNGGCLVAVDVSP